MRERYITARRQIKQHEIDDMRHTLPELTHDDKETIKRHFRHILKDFE
jgi:hypothetical protein